MQVKSAPTARFASFRQANKAIVARPLNAETIRGRKTVTKAAQTDVKHAELLTALEKLVEIKLERPDLPEAEVEPLVQEIVALSNAAGTNVMDLEINNGTFRGFTLSGVTHKRFQQEITLGTLTFNAITPQDLKVRMVGDEKPGVHKGPLHGRALAYCVDAHFTLVDYDVEGVSSVVASSSPDPDHPNRLNLEFEAQRLTPVIRQDGDLTKWFQAFGIDNPLLVDKATGVIENVFPEGKRMKGWLDHVVMLPDYHLVVGHGGSKTLLKRAW